MNHHGVFVVSLVLLSLLVFLPCCKNQRLITNNDKSNIPWYDAKNSWILQSLTGNQTQKVRSLISVRRLRIGILPHFLVVRTPGSNGHATVRHVITYVLRSLLGWNVEHDRFIAKPPHPYSKQTFTNIIATYNPSAKRRLVLACHYDSKLTPEKFLGATDSAVPCSMLIEIALALRSFLNTSPYKNDLTLQLIFFDGEEAFLKWTDSDSLYGSRHLATKWQQTPWPQNDTTSTKTMLDAIDLLVLLDLLGASNPRFYNSALIRSTHFEKLSRIEKKIYGKNAYFQQQIRLNYVEDDHIPFYRKNVAILHVLPDPFPWQWHTLKDNLRNLDFVSIERLTEIIAVFVSEYLALDIRSK